MLLLLGAAILACTQAAAQTRTIKLYIALCDNESQGIVPVPAKIGNGNDADTNLYWGSGEGVRTWFKRSPHWEVSRLDTLIEPVIDAFTAHHKSQPIELIAYAYRGSAIRQCLEDFEAAVSTGQNGLVAYIGHNGLMDFELPPIAQQPKNNTSVAVVCCKSQQYFNDRILSLGAQPILLTTQFMYPGAFIIHDAIEAWSIGGDSTAIRTAAGKAYAKNQNISVKAATGVFADVNAPHP